MSVTIVCPYKKNDSEELLWSLKSLSNINHGKVLIVGDTPPYDVNGDIIAYNEVNPTPHHDQLYKYLMACYHFDGQALLWNDDFFCLEPWTPENYNSGQLSKRINQLPGGAYQKALINTEKFLKSQNLPTLNYELHVPLLIERDKLLKSIEEILPFIYNRPPILIRSYYGNRWGIESTFSEDYKRVEDFSHPFLSTTESSFKGEMGDYIKRKLGSNA